MGSTKKRVRWSTVTVYEFGVAIGGSAVPKRGGPAVGLAKTPEFVWHTTVDAVRDAALRDIDPCIVSGAGSSDNVSGAPQCCDHAPVASAAAPTTCHLAPPPCRRRSASPPKTCRQRRVRWLKPLERVSMLEKAGYSERRIYRMLMESSQIAMSRRLCLRLPTDASSPVRAT